jgi:hypothetical protein
MEHRTEGGLVEAVVDQPVRLELDAPYEIANWRPLVQWFLAIPHLVISSALNALQQALGLASFFMVLFTKKVPPGVYDLQVMVLRYRTRVSMYAGFAHAQYPKFEFSTTGVDPGGDPLRLGIERATSWQTKNAFNWFLAIPHYILLAVYGIVAAVLWVLNLFIVLFTGRWNRGHRDFVVKVTRYQVRVLAYALMLRNEYPSFSLS